MAEVRFVVDKSGSTLFIDAKQKSYNQRTADKTTKRDLVINFRKPKAGDWIVKRTADGRSFREIASQLLRDFLTKHPGSTKDRVYDHLVSRMVQSGKMEAHDFEALLRTVAEEASEGRWYLKETADHLDQAEQIRADAARRAWELHGQLPQEAPGARRRPLQRPVRAVPSGSRQAPPPHGGLAARILHQDP